MNKTMRFSMLAMCLAVAGAQGYSNPIEGGSSQAVSNQWNVAMPWLMVGGNSAGNAMVVDGGQVNNQIGYIGNAASSSSNSATVTGAGSIWNSAMELSVGKDGSGNALAVADGGRVETENGYVGNNSDGNSATIDGSGSQLNAATLHVGHLGSGNTLAVSNGGKVETANGTIGYWIGADNNTATVQGSNSLWQSSATINVGDYASGNRLNLADGGRVESPVVNLGVQSASSSNTLSVTGNGSILDAPEIHIGGSSAGAGGTGNRVEVASGGTAATTDLNIYSGNQFDLNNGGTLAVHTNFNASLAGFNFNSGGTLEVGGELTGMGSKIEDRRSVVMNGSNAVWNKADSTLYVGGNTGGNRLIIKNRAVLSSASGFIGGSASSADSNAVLVTGFGSVWSNSHSLFVGYGEGNTLIIEDGGRVNSSSGWIGASDEAVGNSVVVSRTGSVWNISEGLDVGAVGVGNHMIVSSGGRVINGGSGTIGNSSSASSNYVLVTGVGSIWTNDAYLMVGYGGSENTLSVLNGGRVEDHTSYVGYAAGADSNAVLVAGISSVWKNAEALYFGGHRAGTNWVDGGTGNSLTVSNGGWVQVGDIGTNNIPDVGNLGVVSVGGLDGAEMVVANGSYILSDLAFVGVDPAANGSVTVTGGGSVLFSREALSMEGNGSTLSVLQGGAVESGMGVVGYEAGSSNNSVVVSGAGSMWDSHAYTTAGAPFRRPIGSSATYDVVVPAPGWGGGVTIPSIPLAPILAADRYATTNDFSPRGDPRSSADPSTGQTILQDPVASQKWSPVRNGNLTVGYQGAGNALKIADGAGVYNNTGIIGFFESASGNRVRIRGEGSEWYNSQELFVGHDASGNQLDIENGGQVFVSSESFIGYGETARSNVVRVMGSDSRWMNAGGLNVGYGGSGNTLLIENGGLVESYSGTIGLWETANGNRVVVTGENSMWSNGYLGDDPTNGIPPFDLNPRAPVSGLNPNLVSLVPASSSEENYPEGTVLYESANDITVGLNGSYNTLSILDGAVVSDYNGIIGESSNGWNNAVSVEGTNSTWNNLGNLYLGGRISRYIPVTSNGWERSWVDGGTGNSLYVADGGLVSVGRDMHNRNHSTVSVDSGGHISIASNYYQDATSVLRFGVETNAVGEPLNPFVCVGGTAEFEEGATLQYHSNVGLLDFDTFYTNLIVEANQLIVGGVTNANALDLEAINLDGSLVDVMLWEQDQDIYGLVGRRHLADSAGFEEGTQMAGVSRGIDELSLLGNPNAVAQINLLNGMSSAQQNARLTQRYTRGAPTYRHRQSMQGGQKQVLAQGRAFQSGNRAAKPEGAAGPHQAEQGLRGWVRGYGSVADHDGSSSFSGFDQNVYGTVVGLDKAFGSVLLGAAGGYSGSNLKQDDNDTSDAKTGFGVLYASFGTTDWFGDLNAGYGRSAVTTRSGTGLTPEAEFDADLYSVYMGAGKEIRLSDGGLLLTPLAALNIGYYDQESYRDGLMDIDSYNRWSYQSRLGAALALVKQTKAVLLKPEIRAYWLHEFNADPDRLGYTLGGGRYTFGMQAPDEDILEAGAGISATINDRLELVLDLDGQLGENYSALALGARAVFEF